MKIIKRFFLIILGAIVITALYAGSAFLYRSKVIMDESGGTTINRKDRPNTALLVIDIQTGYTNTPRFAPITEPYISNINKLIEESSSSKVETIYIAAVRGDSILDTILVPYMAKKMSPEAEIDTRLAKGYGKLFVKTKADTFHLKDFESYLERGKIGKLIITGVATEVCVGETAKGGLRRGYEIELVKDASIPIFGEASQENRMKELSALGAKITTTSELTARKHL
jgi:nicotinamidase-related amidase